MIKLNVPSVSLRRLSNLTRYARYTMHLSKDLTSVSLRRLSNRTNMAAVIGDYVISWLPSPYGD